MPPRRPAHVLARAGPSPTPTGPAVAGHADPAGRPSPFRRRHDLAGQGSSADTVTSMALRVVFADDNYLVREGVSALLAEVVPAAFSGRLPPLLPVAARPAADL